MSKTKGALRFAVANMYMYSIQSAFATYKRARNEYTRIRKEEQRNFRKNGQSV